jgi:hypothetical protein
VHVVISLDPKLVFAIVGLLLAHFGRRKGQVRSTSPPRKRMSRPVGLTDEDEAHQTRRRLVEKV